MILAIHLIKVKMIEVYLEEISFKSLTKSLDRL